MHNELYITAKALAPVLGHFDGIVVIRLILTFILCGIVGLERSKHERASGLRTHILVGLGACLVTMAGAYGFQGMWPDRDPLILATYVISGIGFLGAGAILRHGTTVRGLTTAATLWGSAGVGITVGSGLGAMAMVMVLLVLITLVPLKTWEMHLRSKLDAGDLAIHLTDEREAVGKTLIQLGKIGIAIKRATVTPGAGETAILRVELVRAMRPEQVPSLVEKLTSLKYISRVDTEDLNLDCEDQDTIPDSDAVDMIEYDVPFEDSKERQQFNSYGQEENDEGVVTEDHTEADPMRRNLPDDLNDKDNQ